MWWNAVLAINDNIYDFYHSTHYTQKWLNKWSVFILIHLWIFLAAMKLRALSVFNRGTNWCWLNSSGRLKVTGSSRAPRSESVMVPMMRTFAPAGGGVAKRVVRVWRRWWEAWNWLPMGTNSMSRWRSSRIITAESDLWVSVWGAEVSECVGGGQRWVSVWGGGGRGEWVCGGGQRRMSVWGVGAEVSECGG